MKIDRNKLSLRQRDNLNLALSEYSERKQIINSRPVALYIELTKNCFARCVYCRPSDWENAPKYNMSKDLFDILLRDYLPYATFVDLRGYGESLMLEDFDRYIERAVEICPYLRLTTSLGCGSKRALQALVDHNVFISVSFDAADKERYETLRKGVNYNTVIKNMEFLSQQIKKKHGSLEGMMRIGIVPLQKPNLEYVQGIIDLAARLGISEIRMSHLHSRNPFDFNLLRYNKRETIDTFDKVISYAKIKGVSLQFGAPPFAELRIDEHTRLCCCKPWMYAMVNYEGKLLFCDWHIDLKNDSGFLGDIREDINVVWNSAYAQKVRFAHTHRRTSDLHYVCKSCYDMGRYADHEHDLDPQFRQWLVTGDEMKVQIQKVRRKGLSILPLP